MDPTTKNTSEWRRSGRLFRWWIWSRCFVERWLFSCWCAYRRYGLVPKILLLSIITDILMMSLPVFAWRMVSLMLFRTRECKIAISPIKCSDSVHSTFKFDWNRTWMFQLLAFCDTILYYDVILSSEFHMIKDCFYKRYARRTRDFRRILDWFGHLVLLEFLHFDDARRLPK